MIFDPVEEDGFELSVPLRQKRLRRREGQDQAVRLEKEIRSLRTPRFVADARDPGAA